MDKEALYREYAKRIEIFHGLEIADVAHILQHGKLFDFPSHKTVFHEGSLGSNLFVVLSGEIGIYKKDKLIATLKAGDAFGEMAVLNKEPRTATAVAISETKLLTLDEHEISTILEKRIAVRFLLNIIHVLSERLERANTKLARHTA